MTSCAVLTIDLLPAATADGRAGLIQLVLVGSASSSRLCPHILMVVNAGARGVGQDICDAHCRVTLDISRKDNRRDRPSAVDHQPRCRQQPALAAPARR